MWHTEAILAGVFVVVVLLEATLLPLMLPALRVDLFLGMVLGVIIYRPFARGFLFVLACSVILQAFTGARLGYFPFVYVLSYLLADFLRNLIYLENTLAQGVVGLGLYVMIVLTAAFFADVVPLAHGLPAFLLSAVLTGLATPLLVGLVGLIRVAYEP